MSKEIGVILLVSTFACGGCRQAAQREAEAVRETAGVVKVQHRPQESKVKQKLPTAFIGKWVGTYADIPDEMLIRKGDSTSQLNITLHATFIPPAEVTGEIIDSDTVAVPEQQISGMPGTARLTLAGDELLLRQSGMGLTFEGRYTRVE